MPAITVIVDGGWLKHSHKHSYNAKSGVGIIIGQRTGKILHIGMRNKYVLFSMCTGYTTRETLASKIGMLHPLRWKQTSFIHSGWLSES